MEMKRKQQNKICGLSKNKIYGFLLQSTYNFPHSPKLCVNHPLSFSPNLPSLGSLKLHHNDSKPTRIQNSKLQCSMSSPYPKCHVHPNHVIILPP
jgi:hypothetical protein